MVTCFIVVFSVREREGKKVHYIPVAMQQFFIKVAELASKEGVGGFSLERMNKCFREAFHGKQIVQTVTSSSSSSGRKSAPSKRPKPEPADDPDDNTDQDVDREETREGSEPIPELCVTSDETTEEDRERDQDYSADKWDVQSVVSVFPALFLELEEGDF